MAALKAESSRGASLQALRLPGGDGLALMQPTLPAEALDEHQHEEAHAVLVLRGRYEHSATPIGAAAPGPLLVLNPPRTRHQDRFAPGEALDRARFLVLPLSAASWWRWQQQIDLPLQAQAYQGLRVQALARRALRCLDQAGGPADTMALEELQLQILQGLQPACEPPQRLGWLERARLRLREQAFDGQPEPLRLSALSAELGVHPVSLCRAFQRRWQRSPSDYLRELRLQQAAALLQSPRGGRLADIALRCGFYDQAHLARHFRAAYGRSPLSYRRACCVQDEGVMAP